MDYQPTAAKPEMAARATTTVQQTYPAYTAIPTWCALSGMSRSSTYEALARGDLRAIKLGARTLVDVTHGISWLDSLPVATVRPHGNKRINHTA